MERVVAVFGTSKAEPGDGLYEIAEALGRLLAEAGFAVINGGYGGTMNAAAKGARQAGGKVIGVTCSAFGRGGPNEYVTQEVRTQSLTERLGTLVDMGQAYVVLAGGTGTLLELAEVWERRNKGFVGDERPILLVGSFWEPLMEMLGRADPRCLQCVEQVAGPAEAVEKLKRNVKQQMDRARKP